MTTYKTTRPLLPPCYCHYDPVTDPCGHSNTSEGCPRHDPQARADWLYEEDPDA